MPSDVKSYSMVPVLTSYEYPENNINIIAV